MRYFPALISCTLLTGLTAKAGIQLLTNGDFETGSLAGWTVTSSVGSGGTWLPDNSIFTPLTGNPTVGPKSGKWYAVTDQFGPGQNALSQSFAVPVGTTSVLLSFDMFINDWGPFFDLADEYMRFGVQAAGANPITGAFLALGTISGPELVTGGVPNPYVHYSLDLTSIAHAGGTYQLDFLESDTNFNMNVGVDNVSVSEVPEPGSVALLASVLAGVIICARRRLA